MDFRLTRELGEKMAEKCEKSPENGSKIGFWGHFCHFSAFFLPSSLVRPEAIFRPFLPDFGPKARRQSLAGQWGRKPFFSLRESQVAQNSGDVPV